MTIESDFFPWGLLNKTSNRTIIVSNEHILKYSLIEFICFISVSMFSILACLPAGARSEKKTPSAHCNFSQLQGTPVATSPTAAVDDGLGLCNVCFVDPKEMINRPKDVQYFWDHENISFNLFIFYFLACLHVLLGCFFLNPSCITFAAVIKL